MCMQETLSILYLRCRGNRRLRWGRRLCLSILYLRCVRRQETSDEQTLRVTFNSLFEMQTKTSA